MQLIREQSIEHISKLKKKAPGEDFLAKRQRLLAESSGFLDGSVLPAPVMSQTQSMDNPALTTGGQDALYSIPEAEFSYQD